MKNKKVVAVVVIILLIGLISWYFNSLEQKVPSPPLSNPSIVSADQQAVALETKQKTDIKKLIDLAKEAPEKLKELMMSSPKMAAMDAMGKAMNASFQFYGKIIDQHGDAVPNVKVVYSMLGFGSFGQPGVNVKRAQSDANGMFVLSGNGSRFSFRSLNKKGYEFARVPSYNTYPSTKGMKLKYKGTPEKPVVIHAWKKIEAEGLVYKEIFIGFSPDGKTYAIDLIQPKKTEGGNSGDIKVTFNRPLDVNRGNRFNWSVSIEAISGGLIETTDVFMNQAPESGYQSVWKLKMKKDSPDYQAEVKRKFYLKSRNGGVYGRLELEFTPLYNNQSVIDAKWWLNPNGSRNLQYDPAKRIYPK